MGNPRNQVAAPAQEAEVKEFKSKTVGSAALKGPDGLVRDFTLSFTINNYNVGLLKDLVNFVEANPEEKISINAAPFFEGGASEAKLARFSHRVYVTAQTLEKLGKKVSDYIELKQA